MHETVTADRPAGALARIWHGAVPADRAGEYLRLMRTVALPDYRSTPGNLGAFVLFRDEGAVTEFLMVTFWESEAAVAAFAGEPIEKAKYYDFDPRFLLEQETAATHYLLYDA